jgi:hypothetical protein
VARQQFLERFLENGGILPQNVVASAEKGPANFIRRAAELSEVH